MYKKSTFLLILIVLIISLACNIPGTMTSTAIPILITATSAPVTDTPIQTEAPVITSTFTTTSSPTLDISETPTLTATLGIPMVTPSSVNVNCRFGPSLDYLATGALIVGETVPITGKLANNSWWEIDNKLDPGNKCWVAASATTTSGVLDPVPVKSAPDAFVIDVSITAPESIDGVCGGPNPTSFDVSITTNGPTFVEYHMAIYNNDGSFRNETPTETLNFASADTKIINPGGIYKTDCGSFYAIIYVTSPNHLEDRVDWTVSQPL